jgi:hypothetical protein
MMTGSTISLPLHLPALTRRGVAPADASADPEMAIAARAETSSPRDRQPD